MNTRPFLFVLSLLVLLAPACGEPVESEDLEVGAELGLGAVMGLGDGELQTMADHLTMLAATDDARSADWARIRGPLGAVDALQEQALLWFALPDGSYTSVQNGPETADLTERPYWPQLMAGETVLGALQVSLAAGRNAAIVAVPVIDAVGDVVGVVGSSIYLDDLSARITQQLDLQPDQVFFAVNDEPRTALNKDPELILLDPTAQDEPDLAAAVEEILASEEGTISYTFENVPRTVLYRRSDVTGWWYGFGLVDDDDD